MGSLGRALLSSVLVVAASAGCASAASLERFVDEQRRGLTAVHVERQLFEETAKSRKYALRVVLEDGLEVEYFLREPKRPSLSRLPAALILAGFETGREALDLVEERDDFILMSMSYPFKGERRPGAGLLFRLRAVARDTLKGGVFAFDYLSARGDVGEDRLVGIGVSFSALFMTPLVAYDKRVDALALIYGGGDLVRFAATRPPLPLALIPGPLLALFAYLLFGELDPLLHIEALAPRPLLIANSIQDEIFPPRSAWALYRRAREPKRILWYDTGHGDLFDPRVVVVIANDLIDELKEAGFLPAAEEPEAVSRPAPP